MTFFFFFFLSYFKIENLRLNGLTDLVTLKTGIILIFVPRFMGFNLVFK